MNQIIGSQAVNDSMQQAVRDHIFPSAELLIVKNGEVVHHNYYGDARHGTAFDIASLTKPISTSTLTMILTSEGKIFPNQTLSDWFEFVPDDHKEITIENLQNHTSGLPAWRPYYRELPSALVGTEEGKNFIIDACLNEPLQEEPGIKTTYSDLGYILLGEILSRASKMPLDELFVGKISKPLNLRDTFFIHNVSRVSTTSRKTETSPSQHVPIPSIQKRSVTSAVHRRFAATEDCPWRGKVIHGEVHDQNAFAMGGIAGHAGLFSTALDIHGFLLEFILGFENKGKLFNRQTIDKFFPIKNGLITPEYPGIFVGGWDTPSAKNSAAGHYSSINAIGHLAYTGCSIWLDHKQSFWVVLLTNRIHPSTTNEKIKSFRPHIHDLIYTTLIKS